MTQITHFTLFSSPALASNAPSEEKSQQKIFLLLAFRLKTSSMMIPGCVPSISYHYISSIYTVVIGECGVLI
jgi:hypothetical protein